MGTRFTQQAERPAPWHDIVGAILNPASTVTESLELVDGTFIIERTPLYTLYQNKGLRVPDQYALMRPPVREDASPKVLGVVGKDYELIQHTDFAKALDELVASGWNVETLGILHDGAQLFVTFNAEGFVVNGDKIDVYWVASQYMGKSSMEVFSARTRVVCDNTYRIAERGAIQHLRIPHYQGAKAELDFAVKVLAVTQKADEEFKAQLERMGRVSLVDRQVDEILARVYPVPQAPRKVRFIDELSKNGGFLSLGEDIRKEYERYQVQWLQERERVEATKEAVVERTDIFNQEYPRFAGSAWALWNGLTEVENFKSGKQRGVSVLFGARAETMRRAYKELVSVEP